VFDTKISARNGPTKEAEQIGNPHNSMYRIKKLLHAAALTGGARQAIKATKFFT